MGVWCYNEKGEGCTKHPSPFSYMFGRFRSHGFSSMISNPFFLYPQQNNTMSWAVKIRRNILNG